jgi:hypothetical protein
MITFDVDALPTHAIQAKSVVRGAHSGEFQKVANQMGLVEISGIER